MIMITAIAPVPRQQEVRVRTTWFFKHLQART